MSTVARMLRLSYSSKIFRRAVSTILNGGDPANNLLMKIVRTLYLIIECMHFILHTD